MPCWWEGSVVRVGRGGEGAGGGPRPGLHEERCSSSWPPTTLPSSPRNVDDVIVTGTVEGGFQVFPRAEVEQTIAARFASIVARHADRLAVGGRDGSFTYAELDGLANAFAAELLERRGEDLEPVGLLVEQGPSFALAFLAVVKSGKIVLPLEPSQPPERLRSIVRDAGAATLVCSPAHENLARTLGPGVQAITLRPDRRETAAGTTLPMLSPSSPISVFYTSGSTGRPKGVVDTHRTVLHNVLRYTNQLQIAPGDRLSLLQSPAFSGGLSSLFGALLNGASVHPINFRAEGPAALARWLERERVTIYHSVPAIFRALVAVGHPLPSVRLVRLEGDQAVLADAALFRRHFERGCVLANGLGATECGLVRQFFVDHDTHIGTPTLPVGYPVEDTDALVLGEGDREAAPGEIGELVVRSRYLSPGYWRRPDLTAAAFEERPDEPGLRRYRTGDLGRMQADGCLEYLGRGDAQVKVRGERVEIDAVEAALVSGGLAREAAATTREGPDGAPRLVAFLVPSPGAAPTRSALRRRLASTLPSSSVPTEYLLVDRLPLTEHGKLDRAALGTLEGAPALLATGPIEARDPFEQQLVELWQEILGVGEVGVRDEFLDLGGDSLAAATLLTRIEHLYDVELPFSLVATNGTVAALAAAIGAFVGAVDAEPVYPVGASGGSGAPFFFAHGDTVGGGLYCRRLAATLAADRQLYGVSPPEPQKRVPSLEEIAERRVEAIERICPSGPYLIGGGGLCIAGGMLAFEIAGQLARKGRDVGAVLLVSALPTNASGHARLAGAAARGLGAVLRLDRSHQADLVRWAKRGFTAAAYRMPSSGRPPIRHTSDEALSRLEDGYVPRRFDGRVTVYWPLEAPGPESGPARSWRPLASEVEVVTIPGDHRTAVTMHGGTLAETIRKALVERASLTL